jgi:hypothetical protein
VIQEGVSMEPILQVLRCVSLLFGLKMKMGAQDKEVGRPDPFENFQRQEVELLATSQSGSSPSRVVTPGC